MLNLHLLPIFIFIFVMQGIFFIFAYSSTMDLYKNIGSNRIRNKKVHNSKIIYFVIAFLLLSINLYIFFFIRF